MCDGFARMVQNPAHFENLSVLCEVYLDRFSRQGVNALAMPAPLLDAYECIRKMCSSLLCLYTPIPGYSNSCLDDAIATFKYNGRHAVLTSFKTLVSNVPEWQEAMQEALQYGADTVKLTPKVQALTKEAITLMREENVTQDFLDCVEAMPRLAKSLRQGALNELESACCERVQKVAVKMMKTTDVASLIPTHVSAVSSMISFLVAGHYQGMSDLGAKFQKWQESMAGNLSMTQLTEHMRQIVEADCPGENTEAEINFSLLSDLLRKVELSEFQKMTDVTAVLRLMLASFQKKAGH